MTYEHFYKVDFFQMAQIPTCTNTELGKKAVQCKGACLQRKNLQVLYKERCYMEQLQAGRKTQQRGVADVEISTAKLMPSHAKHSHTAAVFTSHSRTHVQYNHCQEIQGSSPIVYAIQETPVCQNK